MLSRVLAVMAYRWHPKLSETDPDNPSAWATCDRCGFISCIKDMVWQYDFRGSTMLQNTRFLVCGRPTCLDIPNPQTSPIILSPDPLPIFNSRPEPYTVDNTDWLTTDDNSIITTDDGTPIITSNPNPDTPAVVNTDSTVEQAAVEFTTEDDLVIVTESGDGNPIDYEP